MCESVMTEISSMSDGRDDDFSIHREVRGKTEFGGKDDEFS